MSISSGTSDDDFLGDKGLESASVLGSNGRLLARSASTSSIGASSDSSGSESVLLEKPLLSSRSTRSRNRKGRATGAAGAPTAATSTRRLPTRRKTIRLLILGFTVLLVFYILLDLRLSQLRTAHRATDRQIKADDIRKSLSLQPPYRFSTTTAPASTSKASSSSALPNNEVGKIAALAATYQTPTCHLDTSRFLQVHSMLEKYNDRIFIGLILYNNEDFLPTFMQELGALIGVLGRERVFVSIYENGSNDMTPYFLLLLAQQLTALQVGHEIVVKGEVEPHGFIRDEDREPGSQLISGPRIPRLAYLRNKVLEPLLSPAAQASGNFTTVVFMNDAYHCASDILDLIYEKRKQEANMACGLDLFVDPVRGSFMGAEFYDTWVARTINGQALSTLETLGRLAVLHPPSRERYLKDLPFQVFSCWNGLAVIDATAFLSPNNIRLRAIDDSDYASESYLINVDLWNADMGRIMIVPDVKVAYTLSDYEALHAGRRFSSNSARAQQVEDRENDKEQKIQWIKDPPAMVDFRPFNRPRPFMEEPTMEPWNATLR